MFWISHKSEVFARATAVVLWATLITAVNAAVIPAGPNYFETVPAGTSVDFSRDNIPRGFFGPGSDAFIGFIRLQGTPIDPANLGTTDTIMQRLGAIEGLLNARPVSTGLGLIAATLVGVNPLTVTYNLGHNPELWDVSVSLQTNQPQGRITIKQTTVDGGTYDVLLPARLIITFVRRSDNARREVPFALLMGANEVSWSFNANTILVTDHHFCPSCLAGQPVAAVFSGPDVRWQFQPAHR